MGVVKDGGLGTGVNPDGVLFPFIKEVEGAQRLFADMYLGHRVSTAVLPLRVTDISGFTQPPVASRADILIVDAENSIIFDSTVSNSYRYQDWSSRFRIHEWISDEAICRVVQHTGQNDSEDVIVYPSSQTLVDAILDERVSEIWPKQVYKFIVNGQEIDGKVEFVGGYNFSNSLNSVETGVGKKRINSIFVGAVPGSGAGLTPGCDPDTLTAPVIRTINQSSPDTHGAFTLTATNCLWLCRPGTTYMDGGVKKIELTLENESPAKSGVKLKNSCVPCCACQDFVNTYAAIRKLYDRYTTLGNRTESVRSTHQSNIDRWLTQKQCRESSPIKISLIPFRLKEASCAKVAVGVINTTNACRGEMEVDLNFSTPSGLKGFINPDTIFIYDSKGHNPENYSLEGSWPNYKARWNILESQAMAKVKFDMSFTRDADITWEGAFPVLDGEGGDVIFDGRFLVIRDGANYAVVTSIFQINKTDSLASGYKVEKAILKFTTASISVNDFYDSIIQPDGSLSWQVIEQPTSVSVKPYSLRLHHNQSVNIYDDALPTPNLIYSGTLYFDTLIEPYFVSKVSSADYVKLDVTAKVNGTTITGGTTSRTKGLKVF